MKIDDNLCDLSDVLCEKHYKAKRTGLANWAIATDGDSVGINPTARLPILWFALISHRGAIFSGFAGAVQNSVFPIDQNALIAAESAAAALHLMPFGAQRCDRRI